VQEILQRISAKKAKLDLLGPFPPELEKNLYEWFKVALTYSSNAIEGNTLTLAETAQVLEKNITIGGKSINEHLEAINHAQAVDFIRDLAHTKKHEQFDLDDILAIHKIVLQKINDAWAGRLRTTAVRVIGSPIPCPNYLKVPVLMDELITTLKTANDHIAITSAYAHLQLATIHPFVDGNGRTARLLMNLLLLQQNYPLVIIDVKDRATYISVIQKALQGETNDYYNFMYAAIEHSLDEYLKVAHESGIQ
jgi:Fic family protein